MAVKYSIFYYTKFVKRLKFDGKMEPRFNEVPRDWGNWFVLSRLRDIKVLFHTSFKILCLAFLRISFVIPRTLLYRGSLNRG